MSKMVNPAELAGIVAALLTNPSKMGELETAEQFSGFFGDIADVVARYCGGRVREVVPPEDHGDVVTPYLVTIRPDETLPSLARNAWASADPEGFEGVGDQDGDGLESLSKACAEARITVAAAVAELAATCGGKSTVQVGHWELHAQNPNARTYDFHVDDQRASNGQAFVSLTGNKGEHDCMDVSIEVNRFDALTGVRTMGSGPSPGHDTPCVHVHFDGDALAFSVFKWGNALLMRPEVDVRLTRERFGNETCWRIERP